MVDYQAHPVFLQLTTSPESESIGTWTVDDFPHYPNQSRLEYLLEEMSNCTPESIKSILSTCQYLTEYPYPELTLSDNSQKPLFALAMAQAGLLARIRSANKNAGLISALALLLGTNYQLDLDDSILLADIPTHYGYTRNIHPPEFGWINPDDRFVICPEISKLESLNIVSRRMFINLGYYAHNDRVIWTETEELEFDDNVKESVLALCSSGLLDPHPSISTRLSNLTVEKIRSIASRFGIQYLPKRKNDMVEVMVAQCSPTILEQAINEFENDLDPLHYYHGTRHFIHFCVSNRKGLRIFLHQEYDRLMAYLQYIAPFPSSSSGIVITLNTKAIPSPIQDVQNDPPSLAFYLQNKTDTRQQADPPTAFHGDIRKLRISDRNALKSFWDKDCEIIIEKAIHTENTPELVKVKSLEGIIRHFEEKKVFKDYQLATQKEGYKPNWRVVLSTFIADKLRRNKYYQLHPKEITCPGCGTVFLEYSVPLRFAMLVQMNVQFCAGCYKYIFDHDRSATNTYTKSLPDDQILDQLFRLAQALEMIPTRAYLVPTRRSSKQRFIHVPSNPTEKQIAVGTALINMPSYEIYIQRFGNWMTALAQSGVLADGHQVMARGIRCLANDRHVCLSLGEKTIDDWLTAHGIPHEKEVPYPYDPRYNPDNRSRMDWKVGEVFIEYAGMMIEPDYRRKMDWKVSLSTKKNFYLVILEPEDLECIEKKLGFLIDSRIEGNPKDQK